MENESDGALALLDVCVSCLEGKFGKSVYHKSTFYGIVISVFVYRNSKLSSIKLLFLDLMKFVQVAHLMLKKYIISKRSLKLLALSLS